MIVFVHLLNDRSGSPRVLRNVMNVLADCDGNQQLFLGSGGDGFLGQALARVTRYRYRRHPHRLATLLSYLASQCALLWKLSRSRDIDRDAVVYVNTLLPFAAAIYGRLTGKRVIYHLHEAGMRPRLLYRFLMAVARFCADRTICVSDFHRRQLGLEADATARTVLNSVDSALFARGLATGYQPVRDGLFNVCMLCSLRDYKGVPEFLHLASRLASDQRIRFQLVLSDEAQAVRRYFAGRELPANLTLRLAVQDTADVYAQAGLVMSLTRVDQCQETFGLTLLEAMSFGIPVIAPPVGGPAELVDDGVHGYLIDSRDADALLAAVVRLAASEALCMELSENCRKRAQSLSPQAFATHLRRAVFDA